jgi:ligand-binding SRPBCC domain-containing protein
MTYRLERQQLVPLPRDQVFSFFADAANLQAITPDSLHFHMLTPLPIEMRAGTLIEYRLRLFGLPVFWRTRIEEYDPPHRFVDVQLRGPYADWRHTHEFAETPGGTLMTDRVDYRIPLGPLGRLAHALFVQRMLRRIFDYRQAAVERLLPRIRPA